MTTFPQSPLDGQTYQSTNGTIYKYNQSFNRWYIYGTSGINHLDGGRADSVYTPIQHVDGGGA